MHEDIECVFTLNIISYLLVLYTVPRFYKTNQIKIENEKLFDEQIIEKFFFSFFFPYK